ncbi:hypothetical protein CJU90_0500 [Yarrowia sp. C11]|nr:hypothetical protein CKK34_1912 [Yarrowia sp. E02]KAG5372844.1 hypothetical protein CJU90_0500 [Yarrowia sp. C11]
MTTVETIRKQLEELLPTTSNVANSLLIELPDTQHVTSTSTSTSTGTSTSSPSSSTHATILYSSFEDSALASKYASLAVRHVNSARELAQLGGSAPQLLRIRSSGQEIFILPSSDRYILLAISEVA